MQSVGSQELINRMIGAAKLDVATYEEVERDQNATTQALIVVALAGLAAGIGTLNSDGFRGLISGTIGGLIGWAAFSAVVYFFGTRLLGTPETEADIGQLLRTLGFANTPRILYVVGFIPVLGLIVVLIAGIWFIAASVIAIRQALEMSTLRAIATGIVAGIAMLLVFWVVALILDTSLPGMS